MRTIAFLFVIACASGQVELPRLGMTVDQSGAARPVYGVAASATLGDALASGVISIGCSKRLCLMKTDSSMIASTGETADAPSGPALFALDGDIAWMYFPDTRQLARWKDGQLSLDSVIDGKILSLREAGGGVEFAIASVRGVWIVRQDGTVVGTVPDADGPVMLLRGGVIFSTRDSLVLRRKDGTEVRFNVTGSESLFSLGEGYIGARTASATWAIRTTQGREQAFLLPGSTP